MNILFVIFVSFCLLSCDKQTIEAPTPTTSFNWQRINSRDEGIPSSRYPLYSAKIPSDWIRIDPPLTESIIDTTKPLCEFFIEEGEEKIRITIHNFPTESIQQRVPPIAQINRWRGQFEQIDPTLTSITPQSHNGFVGLFLDCQGILNGQPTRLLGWSMQLASEYYHILSIEDSFLSKQERADYTIKALGPSKLMDKHKESIIDFATSFELIEELPTEE